MEFYLRQIRHGNPSPLNIVLSDEVIVIGIAEYPELILYPQVSPLHAYFVRKQGEWYVKDLNSSCGTFVNGLNIGTQQFKLEIGDHIGFGVENIGTGFLCALSVRERKFLREPEVVQLSDEHLTYIKEEPEVSILNQRSESCQFPDFSSSRISNNADFLNVNIKSEPNAFIASMQVSDDIEQVHSSTNSSIVSIKLEPMEGESSPSQITLNNCFINMELKKETDKNVYDTLQVPVLHTNGTERFHTNSLGLCSVNSVLTFNSSLTQESVIPTPSKILADQEKSSDDYTKPQLTESHNSKISDQLRIIKKCYVPLVRCDDKLQKKWSKKNRKKLEVTRNRKRKNTHCQTACDANLSFQSKEKLLKKCSVTLEPLDSSELSKYFKSSKVNKFTTYPLVEGNGVPVDDQILSPTKSNIGPLKVETRQYCVNTNEFKCKQFPNDKNSLTQHKPLDLFFSESNVNFPFTPPSLKNCVLAHQNVSSSLSLTDETKKLENSLCSQYAGGSDFELSTSLEIKPILNGEINSTSPVKCLKLQQNNNREASEGKELALEFDSPMILNTESFSFPYKQSSNCLLSSPSDNYSFNEDISDASSSDSNLKGESSTSFKRQKTSEFTSIIDISGLLPKLLTIEKGVQYEKVSVSQNSEIRNCLNHDTNKIRSAKEKMMQSQLEKLNNTLQPSSLSKWNKFHKDANVKRNVNHISAPKTCVTNESKDINQVVKTNKKETISYVSGNITDAFKNAPKHKKHFENKTNCLINEVNETDMESSVLCNPVTAQISSVPYTNGLRNSIDKNVTNHRQVIIPVHHSLSEKTKKVLTSKQKKYGREKRKAKKLLQSESNKSSLAFYDNSHDDAQGPHVETPILKHSFPIMTDNIVSKLNNESQTVPSIQNIHKTSLPTLSETSNQISAFQTAVNYQDVYDFNMFSKETHTNKRQTNNFPNSNTALPKTSVSSTYLGKGPVLAPPTNTEDFYKAFPQLRPSPKKNCSTSNQTNQSTLITCPFSLSSEEAGMVNYKSMIKIVVELDIKWLVEYTQIKAPPPVISNGIAKLPLFFNSFEHYVSSFLPLLRLDVWEYIHQASWKLLQDPRRSSNHFTFSILSVQDRTDINMTEYHCDALVGHSAFAPLMGNLVILAVKDKESSNCTGQEILGYITNHTTVEIESSLLSKGWSKFNQIRMEPLSMWRFSVLTKYQQMSPLLNCLFRGNGICFIKNKLLLANHLASFKSSPLCQSILLPDEYTFFSNEATKHNQEDLTESMITKKLIERINENKSKPIISLLSAPPGTEKMSVILNLLVRFSNSKKPKPKVLILTQSDTSTDNIGTSIASTPVIQNGHLKLVCIGNPDLFAESLKPYTMKELTVKKQSNWYKKEVKSFNQRFLENEQTLAVLKTKVFPQKKKVKRLMNRQKHLEDQLRCLHLLEKDWVQEVLNDSHVVLATLECFDDMFQNRSTTAFSCCIVDNSTQFTELEILRTSTYNISNLVLIGDHKQLPPLLHSKLAASYGYARSMFERFYCFFQKYHQRSPLLELTMQYSMHSEICEFPSKYFYNSKLKTPHSIDVHYDSFPLYPYIVYDIAEIGSLSLKSAAEAYYEGVVNMCVHLLGLNLASSIGIIVSNEADSQTYLSKLRYYHPILAQNQVEVSTVEQIEGRNKDIIILLCWNSSLGSEDASFLTCEGKLNVALTRARQCLILCLCSFSLNLQSVWGNLLRDAKRRHLYKAVDLASEMAITFDYSVLKSSNVF